MESVGERLKKIRKENNYTQDMLADKLKLEPAAISKYETNRVPIPQEYIIKICDLFNISTDYLLGRTDEQNTVKEIDKKLKDYNIHIAANSKVDLGKLAKLDDKQAKIINNLIDDFLSDDD